MQVRIQQYGEVWRPHQANNPVLTAAGLVALASRNGRRPAVPWYFCEENDLTGENLLSSVGIVWACWPTRSPMVQTACVFVAHQRHPHTALHARR